MMNNLRTKALEHYHYMMIWAGIQDPHEKPYYPAMSLMLKEHWYGECCSYCKIFCGVIGDSDGCGECILKNKDLCCGGLWGVMDRSKTWPEWIKNAWEVHQYIAENG